MNKPIFKKGVANESKRRMPVPPEILDGILAGDESAFTEYYAGVISALVSFVTRMTGDEDEAVNIAHDALIKLWEERGNIKQLTGGFVYTIATGDSLDLIRRREVHEKYVNEQAFVQNGEAPAADHNIMYEELEAHYNKIIADMPPQRRKVFEMSRYDGMTHGEIAKRLGLSPHTVNVHIQAAMKDLVKSSLGVFILFFMS